MQRKGRSFIVKLDIPPGASEEAVCSYIEEAVATWRGCLNPGHPEYDYTDEDPMFSLDGDSVSARPRRKV